MPGRSHSGRQALSRSQAAEDQLWRILSAAAELFAEGGYSGLTSAAIARRAGVSPSAFYRHFADVDACLLVAYRIAADTVVDLVFSACAGGGAGEDRLAAAFEAAIAFLRAESSLGGMLVTETCVAVGSVQETRDELVDRLHQLLPSRWAVPDGAERVVLLGLLGFLGERAGPAVQADPPTLSAELSELVGPWREARPGSGLAEIP